MSYILGISIAIVAGCLINFGVLLQKKVINDHIDDAEFLRSISKNPVWITGIVIQIVIGGAIFFMIAQVLLGPTLVPSLMSGGLIILALGSVKILKEKLQKEEILGIILMMGGISTISLSELSIDMSSYNVLEIGFLIRMMTLSGIIFLCVIVVKIIYKFLNKGKGISYALQAGLINSLTSIWIGPVITFLTHLSGNLLIGEILLFIPSITIIAVCTTYGIIYAQKAFQCGQVNILSPLVGVPNQLIPIFLYFFIFNLIPINIFPVIYLFVGISSIITSSFLLATRQVKLEEIKV